MARILIAEDEPHIMRVMSLWLRQHGHETIEAPDGRSALDALASSAHGVALIISDVNMPGLDGVALVRVVRERCGFDIPIMLVTARCDQSAVADQMKTHNVHLFPKPFVPSRLVAQIDQLLAASAAPEGTR